MFAVTYLFTGGIFAIVMALAKNKRVHVFRRVSPGLLSPLGAIFGLLVVFIIFQVFNDFDRAQMAVDREASAIRTVVLLAGSFSGVTRRRFATWSGAISTKRFRLSGPRWRNKRHL